MRVSEAIPFRDVLDAIDTGLAVVDREGRVRAWSGWLAKASDISEAKALGQTIADIFPGAKLERLERAMEQAVESGASSLITHSLHPRLLPLRTRAGHELIHDVSVQPVGRRPYPGCVLHVVDVSVAVRRERVLRDRQNARYDSVVKSAPDAILTLDAEGHIQLANPAASQQFGFGAQELVGHPMTLLFREQVAWDATWAAVLRGETLSRPVQVVATRRDGSPSYLEVSASRWVSDSRVFVTAILRDVNERHAAEQAMRELNRTLERRVAERTADRDRMWRLSTDIMLVARLDGTINAINPAWTRLLGWEERDLVGACVIDFIVDEDRERYRTALNALTQSPEPQRFELRMPAARDGEIRVIEWNAVAADDLLQALGRDITAEREAEQALRQVEEELRQSQKMEAIGRLTGGIAHDFNNLLSGIIGSIDILKRRIAAGRFTDLDRFMDAAVTSANRAAALTHRLLAFARRQPLNARAVDANDLVRGMEDLLRRSLGERVEFATDLADDLWPTMSDAHQLENALLNLAINARDAMPNGGRLTIQTRNVVITAADPRGLDQLEPGEYTAISVCDTGVGMSADVMSKVFEPFFTTKPLGQGTGLGLSMIYGFAKQSRGQVRINSAPNEGAEITLFLPSDRIGAIAAAPALQQPVPDGAGEVVLLVEDDPAVRLLIAELLRDVGYVCVEVSDGQSALPVITGDGRIDLLITDVGLPGLNGRQVAEVARRCRPGLGVLFVTGYAEHAIECQTFLGPGMEMVTKPFDFDSLAATIHRLIASSAGERACETGEPR